ncbi:hypothetical protein LINPERHAP2_LOCUS42873 [Linum perenne]
MEYYSHLLHHDDGFFLNSHFDDDEDQWSHQIDELGFTDDYDSDSDQWPVLDVSNDQTLSHLDEIKTTSSLSTEDVMRLAGMRMVQMSSDISISGLSDRDVRSVALTGYLLSSADHVAKGRFNRALGLLGLCDRLASTQASPVERVVHYFSKALRAKIAEETGTVQNRISDHDIIPSFVQQIQRVAATRVIIDDMALSRKIHVKSMNPSSMEASHESACFATRFVEALFHYGALFDCLDTCMADKEAERTVVESTYMSELIMNDVVVAWKGIR